MLPDLKKDKIIAIDTETHWSDKLLMHVPFIATTTDQMLKSVLYDMSKEEDITKLKVICEDSYIVKVFHNAAYDITCLNNIGIKCIPPYEDTMVMASIVNENFSSKKLKSLAKQYLHEPCNEEKELNKIKAKIARQHGVKLKDFQYSWIPPEVLYPYALKDTEYTIKLFYLFFNRLKEFRDIYDMEMKLIPIIVNMQLNGISVDRDFLADRIIKFGTERYQQQQLAIEEVKKMGIKFYQKVGKKIREVEFKPLSVAHLRKIWEHLNLPVLAMTEGKIPKISTGAIVLKELLENEEKYEQFDLAIVRYLARFRFIHKQLSTYAVPLYTHYTNDSSNRAHFSFWQSGAKTGRFSAELIQTMPRIDHDKGIEDVRMIRFAFVPKPGHILAFIDYDQIEMRTFAHFSDSTFLIADLNAGFDPHMGTVYNIFDKELIDSNPIIRDTFRSMIKAINFGIIYGLGRKGLIIKIKDMIYRASHVNPELRPVFEEILRDIDGVLRRYYEKYPADKYTKELISTLYKQGFVEINFKSELMNFRRIYRTPTRMAYKATNMICQGCISGESRVYEASKGYVKIKDLVNEKVIIWDGTDYVNAECICSGEKEAYKINMADGNEIICSEDHKLLIVNTNGNSAWWKVKDLLSRNLHNCRVEITDEVIQADCDIELPEDKRICKRESDYNKKYLDFNKLTYYEIGILIGRLVSDGSITFRGREGGNSLSWFIAEHEYDIYDYLVALIKQIGDVSESVQQKKNEKIYCIELYSTDLVVRLLECKTKIPQWLFSNGEALRGYLCGMFDGDGTISKQGDVKLTFGIHVNTQLVLDIQQALLLFNINSRINLRADYQRQDLNIKRIDNIKFMNKIGLLSKNKLDRRNLMTEVITDKRWINTVVIKSIEKIESEVMYDIVNSDSERFMTNGIITHNSAAYIMKTGMIRAYDWIEKNASYVKLLLTVHDELIFEIPKDKPYTYIMMKLEELMSDLVTLKIPINASIKATEKDWGNAYNLALDGYCKKHGKLPIPDKYGIAFCSECKKKYYVLPYKQDVLRTIDNKIVLEQKRDWNWCTNE